MTPYPLAASQHMGINYTCLSSLLVFLLCGLPECLLLPEKGVYELLGSS
jgi:hypothetical protein